MDESSKTAERENHGWISATYQTSRTFDVTRKRGYKETFRTTIIVRRQIASHGS